MPSFLEREQLLPVAPSIAPADQILGAFGTQQSLFGMGAAQLKSAQSNYANMPLSNPQNQQQLDGLMQTANQQLKTASMKDLSIGDNQSSALSVFDPIIKDQDIMGDHALTQGWNQDKQKAQSDRTSNGGKNFNSDALRAINAQQALFSKSDKSTWRNFYNNKESYSPYYNTFDETQKIAKSFKTDVIDKDTQNGAYITTTKNSSWYKDKWQAYFEANASPQLKAQLAQKARADYYTDMLTIPREAIVQKYTDLRNGLINKQIGVDYSNLMNKAAQLALKHTSKDNEADRAELSAQANYLSDAIDRKKQALNTPLEGADSIGTIEGLATGTRIAEGLGQYQYFDRIGDAFAHKEEKFSIKPDFAYLGLAKMKEQAREFGLRLNETSRHNRADELHNTNMEGIDMIKAQADMMRALREGKGSSSTYDFAAGADPNGNGLTPGSANSVNSNPESVQAEGKNILDNLSSVHDKYNKNYDQMSSVVFGSSLMGELEKNLADPSKQGLTLKDIADPTKAPDGTGGNSGRLIKFLVAAGALQEDPGAGLLDWATGRKPDTWDPAAEAYSMPLSQVKQMLRQIWSDPAMFKKGIEAIKGNDPSLTAYGISAQLEKQKQRIDGEHSDIINQAIPILKTNLEKYAPLLDRDYLSKGIIPTRDQVRKSLDAVPLSALKDEIGAGDIPTGDKFRHAIGLKSQDDLFRDVATDNIMKKILGTLGNNRTAYNSGQETYGEGRLAKDNPAFESSLLQLLSGAPKGTKGHPEYDKVVDYANNYPSSVDRVTVHTVDEAHPQPTFQIYFKEARNSSERLSIPQSGVQIPTASASSKFNEAPADDRTTLLNGRSLKFQSEYNDGTKSNLSIYNATGSKENPQFDINQDFSYKSLDIDRTTGNIRGIKTVYKPDEVRNLTGGRPDQLSDAINRDPTQVYNILSDKLIKNRDAVNEYLKSNGLIKNVSQLPEYIKEALRNNSF